MKAAVTDGKGSLELIDIPTPEPEPYQCVCRLEAAVTCSGTDQKIISGKLFPGLEYPGVLGHETIGRTVSCGSKVRYIKKGDRFLRPTAVYFGTKYKSYASLFGGFAEYGLITDSAALQEDGLADSIPAYAKYQQHVPEDVPGSPEELVQLVTLKEIAGFIRLCGISFNSSVLILGTGPVAMSMAYFTKLAGARLVIAAGRREDALSQMTKIGADFKVNCTQDDYIPSVMKFSDSKGVDFVLDAAGSRALLKQSCRTLTSGGQAITYAVSGDTNPGIEQSDGPGVWSFRFGGPAEDTSHEYVCGLVKLGAIPLTKFYSHTMPFNSIKKGFELLQNKQASKVVFTF